MCCTLDLPRDVAMRDLPFRCLRRPPDRDALAGSARSARYERRLLRLHDGTGGGKLAECVKKLAVSFGV